MSHETISNVTKAVDDEGVPGWQTRPLEAFYPVIYLDALVVKVRDQNRIVSRHARLAVGVDVEGHIPRSRCPGPQANSAQPQADPWDQHGVGIEEVWDFVTPRVDS